MNSWDHVIDGNTRDVLSGRSLDSDSIADCLSWSEQCLQADQHNEEVSEKVYLARCNALNDAFEWWNEHGDTGETIEALRRFWSV